MSRSRLIILLSAATAVVVAVSVAAFVVARGQFQEQSSAQPTSTAAGSAVLSVPHITFRNATISAEYGTLAAVTLADPKGPRAFFGISCERQTSNRNGGVCVRADRGVVTSYELLTLDANLKEIGATPLNGTPSRVRMSADASLVATTTFVTGHSYADTAFVTEAIIHQNGQLRRRRRYVLRHRSRGPNDLAHEGFGDQAHPDLIAHRRRVPGAVP